MHRVSNILLEKLLHHLGQTEQFAFFDTSRPTSENTASYLFTAPRARLQCTMADDGSAFLGQLQEWLNRGYYLAGWFGYEFGTLLDGRLAGRTGGPSNNGDLVADLGVYAAPYRFDHLTGVGDFPLGSDSEPDMAPCRVDNLQPNITQAEYFSALGAILEYIRAGDTYQVNYTLKLLFKLSGSAESLYRDLRRNQSVSYGAYLRWGEERILSFSPELFFRKKGDTITVRPMKGTLQRGKDNREDASARDFLHRDEKNRSENVMIVDLLRNDLARVLHESAGGEVWVESLFDVETYESLLQMTSTIHARTDKAQLAQIPLLQLFRALFPCGSVTGAPKIRTMEIIAEQERQWRGVYTGAIGFLEPDGSAVFNVPIRTLVLNGRRGEMGIGSGITHDSDPQEEWRECLLKGRFLTDSVPEFGLIETLLWRPDSGYWLLAEHLDRLRASAHYFRFCCDLEKVQAELEAHVGATAKEARRVRLVLAKDGTLEIDATPCALPQALSLPVQPHVVSSRLPRVRFSPTVMDSRQPWLGHKTTRREIYNREFQQAREQGFFDFLYLNERGEVTEGAVCNVIVYRDGHYCTPPLSSGLLPGVMRQKLLQDGAPPVHEEVLKPADIVGAEGVFLCNSVRGVVQVRLEEG